MSRPAVWLGVILLAGTLLAACGGDELDVDPVPTPTPLTAEPTTASQPDGEDSPEPPPADDVDREFEAMVAEIEERFEDMTGDSLKLDCSSGDVPDPGESVDCSGRATEQEFEYAVTIIGTEDGYDFEYALQY